PYHPDAGDTNVMFYSGAATGPAKYAKYSNRMIARSTNDFLSMIPFRPADIIFSPYPLTHFLAYVAVLNGAVTAGASIALCDPLNEKEFRKTMEAAQPTVMVAEPAYIGFLANQKEKEYLPASLQYAITGGGRLKSNYQEAFTALYRIPVYKIYGMVEAGPLLTVNTNADKPASIGIPLSSVSISLRNGRQTAGDEQIGEICVTSNILTEDLKKLLHDKVDEGWYRTGDLGRLDMDGYLYFVDRKAYVINVRGFNVYPEQIESVLVKHPKVQDAVVVGVPLDTGSESIHAHIIPENGKRPEERELLDFLELELPRYQIPEKFIFVNHFPRSATGKVVRQALK
ncbi:MAG: long-chain fatty acid--CoA ligase, partial [Candidatus Marinimicrobia bacterium]|nr:long-chain fatty acid--CoA ligase [Candidatus Neomarinimicrobiota bacterium]